MILLAIIHPRTGRNDFKVLNTFGGLSRIKQELVG